MGHSSSAGKALPEARAAVCSSLRRRRSEIEQAVLARVYAVGGPVEASDSEYGEGLRATISALVEYGLAAFESCDEHPPLPAIVLSQARMAARNGVSLDVVLRRYFAGYNLLGDFIGQEMEDRDYYAQKAGLQDSMRSMASLFDRLVVAVTEAYVREPRNRLGSKEERRAEQIERLLMGELVATSDLGYDLEGWHVAAVAGGTGAVEAVRDLAQRLDRRLLVVRKDRATVWAWLGGRQCMPSAEIANATSTSAWPPEVFLALGEAGQGFTGWRLSHQQACAASPIALRKVRRLVRYADVALLASTLQDELLTASLRQIYLAPLAEERDGGAVLRKTLRAYFAAERNVSSAAAALGVSRRTVANRLQRIEEMLDCPLSSALAAIETALCLDDHDATPEGL